VFEVPNWLAGGLTVVALVGCGVFLFPWLLKRRGGALLVAAVTMALALLYMGFDSDNSVASTVLTLLWAAAPAIVGAVVYRLQSR
jgi:hypothetical protein